MDLELTDSTAIVIGGAKGIGRAIAKAFVAEGATCAILDLDPQVMQTAEELGGSGHIVDVTDYDAVARIAQSNDADHVVYSAGVGSRKYGCPFWNLSPSDWQFVIDVNLVGAVHAAHAFAPAMTERRSGSMLFISSIAGQIGSQTDPPYSAAKAGLINFAQCAAKDLAEFNVRANTICPGMIKTAINQSVWQAWAEQSGESMSYEDWAAEKIQRVTPLRRWQKPQDIANLAVFLASSRANNITGQTMNVDGGQVMHW